MENFIFCAVQKMMVVSKYKQRSKTKKYICVIGLDSCSSTCFNYPLNLEFCFRRLFLTKILVLRTIMEVFCKTLNGNITIEIEPELFLLISTSYCNFVRLFQVESLLEYFRTLSEFFPTSCFTLADIGLHLTKVKFKVFVIKKFLITISF